MNLLQTIKERVDIHEVATRLGLQRPHQTGNYRSPHHPDKNPSVSLFVRDGIGYYKDHSTGRGGDVIDFVQDMGGMDFDRAVDWLCSSFGIARQAAPQPAGELTKAEWIASRCRANTERAIEYLVGRGIPEEICRDGIQQGAVGFNDWHSAKVEPGQFGHGGAAVAFIVRSLNPGKIVAVDMRYLDPDLNGGVKTQSQGQKEGAPWVAHLPTLKKASTVYVVESPINALSVQAAQIPHATALATRGVATVDGIDWRFLSGKRVVICMDNDKPQPDGRRPGPEAAWRLHALLTDLGIAAFLVDQGGWQVNDVNDFLQAEGAQKLRVALETLEPWAITGLPAAPNRLNHRARVFLPEHDYKAYQFFRVKEDFTVVWKKAKNMETGEVEEFPVDLAGFRLVAIERVSVQSPQATYSGLPDSSPEELFSVVVQTPGTGAKLIRKAFRQDDLFRLEKWSQFGHIWNLGAFMRLVTIHTRIANSNAKAGVNFVGLCWRDGKLIVNEGKDCYFIDGLKQCFYRNLLFHSGTVQDARRIISAYQATFQKNAAAMALIWVIGAHLKVLLGFWPHAIMEAEKATGKTTFMQRLEGTGQFSLISGQGINTEWRIIASIGYSSHPIGWDEFSQRDQKKIDHAVAILQESYKFSSFPRGMQNLIHLNSAPVLISGESIQDEAHNLLGKLIRIDLELQGPLLPDDLPIFPFRQWLDFLAGLSKAQVKSVLAECIATCQRYSRSDTKDKSASRIIENYASLLLAWRLVAEFAGISDTQGEFPTDLIAQMNSYLATTRADRHPWVWILEVLFNEISAGNFKLPYSFENQDDIPVIIIKPQHVMHHLKTSPGLRNFWDALPIKSARIFKKQLQSAGVIYRERMDITFNGQREFHCMALSLPLLEEYGLFASQPER